jgi:hypothetical protein
VEELHTLTLFFLAQVCSNNGKAASVRATPLFLFLSA